MEKLIVGVSLEAIFNVERLQGYGNRKSEVGSSCLKGPLFDFIKQLNQIHQKQSEVLIEIVVVSDHAPHHSVFLFDVLEETQLDVSQVILTGSHEITSYLVALEVELYLSSLPHLIQMAQQSGILAGYVKPIQQTQPYRFAFDHRLFADEGGYPSLGKWLPLLGFIQRTSYLLKVGMITTRCYSLESWVKELFKLSQCRIDEICFVAYGRGEEISRLFDFTVYFEGLPRQHVSIAKPSKCILNIDF